MWFSPRMVWCEKRCAAKHRHQYPTDQARTEASRLAHLIPEQPDTAEEWRDFLAQVAS